MQVAFAPNITESERHFDDLYQVRLRSVDGTNQNWKVFVSSWLGFGANEAKRRFAQHLIESDKSHAKSTPISDPCYLQGTLRSVEVDSNTTAEFSGAGNLKECLKSMQPLLRKDMACKDEPCLFNGMHVPAIDFATDRFVGVSEYWYTANDIFKLGGKYDFTIFSTHVNAYCGSSWQDILKDKNKKYKNVAESSLESACFRAAWVINILHSGFGMPFDEKFAYGLDTYTTLKSRGIESNENDASFANLNKRDIDFLTPFQSASSIEGTELTWMLGRAVLYASSQVPAASSQLPDVGFLPADSTETHFVVGGEVFGVMQPNAYKKASHSNGLLGLFLVLACLSLVVYYYFAKHKRAFRWVSAKARTFVPPRLLNKFRLHTSDSYQRILEEGGGIGRDTILGSPIVSLPSTFHAPVSAKSTSMIDLSKLADDSAPVNRVPSRPPSRANSRLNLNTMREDSQGYFSPDDLGVSIKRSSSRLFQTQSVERLPLMRP